MTRPKQHAPRREDWDFRSVKKEHFHIAAEYEYLRELVRPVQARKARRLLKEFDKIKKPRKFPYRYPSMDDVPLPLMLFAQKYPAFPQAWLKLTDKTRARYAGKTPAPAPPNHPALYHVYDGFHVIELEDVIGENEDEGKGEVVFDWDWNSDPVYDRYGTFTRHLVQLNWGLSNKRIAAEFNYWLKAARPKGVVGREFRGRGKYPNPITTLKWLSAFRFQKAGVTHKKAQNRIFKILKQGALHKHYSPNPDPHKVLPDYLYASGWDGAIKKAKGRLRKIASRSD